MSFGMHDLFCLVNRQSPQEKSRILKHVFLDIQGPGQDHEAVGWWFWGVQHFSIFGSHVGGDKPATFDVYYACSPVDYRYLGHLVQRWHLSLKGKENQRSWNINPSFDFWVLQSEAFCLHSGCAAATLHHRQGFHCSELWISEPLRSRHVFLAGLESMILMGMPVDSLLLNKYRDRVPQLQAECEWMRGINYMFMDVKQSVSPIWFTLYLSCQNLFPPHRFYRSWQGILWLWEPFMLRCSPRYEPSIPASSASTWYDLAWTVGKRVPQKTGSAGRMQSPYR